ncbi:MAG TPA: 1-acyl-sn-glycerol-3-phosphate acyltransferase [Clostridia bacterium]|nr:1-acyl-sn-glycerol-3-phosphate acyltransferase [Clostridia bacterium]
MKIEDNAADIKSPFIALVNHTSVNDAFVTAYALKKFQPNYLTAVDQIVKNKALYTFFGAIPKRQFISEISAVKSCKYVLSKKRPIVIFPEGKLSVDGKTGIMPYSIAKLVKFLGVDVIAVNISGNYLGLPRWSKIQVKTDVEVKISPLFSKNELDNTSIDTIYEKITDALSYDEYKRQQKKNIKIERNLDGLETILYRCPKCGQEFCLTATENKLICGKCGTEFMMDCYGKINGTLDVPSWYEMQRKTVFTELQNDRYLFSATAEAYELPNITGYKYMGVAKITANKNGIKISVGEKNLFIPPQNSPTLAFDGGKRFFISTVGNTYRFEILDGKGIEIAKLNLAVEENFKIHSQK